MRLAIVSIGYSRGIRLPEMLLDKYGFGDAVDVELYDDAPVLKAVRKPRDGWEVAFQQMHENGDDTLAIPDLFDDEN